MYVLNFGVSDLRVVGSVGGSLGSVRLCSSRSSSHRTRGYGACNRSYEEKSVDPNPPKLTKRRYGHDTSGFSHVM